MPEFSRLDALQDIIIVKPRRFEDARGFFSETYNADAFAKGGITDTFVQDNHSLSKVKGTIRGLHFQSAPRAQGKLVRCARGRLLDVFVDIRPGSRTFGQYGQIEICAENGLQIYIPAGFAHGFCTLEDNTEIVYKVTDFYSAAHDAGIKFDDADLGIDWPCAEAESVISDKDQILPSFAAFCREHGVSAGATL
jgi:dTDP-4-dehydrorhamnose 3,5-epimerase